VQANKGEAVIRKRMLAVTASATIALTGIAGVAAVPAGAKGSHWSPAKCQHEYLKWYRKHLGKSTTVTPKQSKEIGAYIKKLEKQHHCVIGG
jgi:hypothetical protein